MASAAANGGYEAKSTGSVGLIHPETHFTDEKAALLRAATYRRLRRHWQFLNELVLFEIDHHVSFGVHTYGAERDPSFLMATSLYHPDTAERSLKHDGSGSEPGLKDDDGNWDLRPHASRIQRVNLATLGTWHAVLEPDDVPVAQSRMVYTVNRSTAAVLDKLSRASRIGSLGLHFSRGWDESIDRKKGFFDSEWGVPESWDSVILQGPHIHVATPFYKQPNPTMKHNQDWTAVDLEALPPDAIPATSYKPRGDRTKYDDAYTHWETESEGPVAARDFYRVAWRMMAANTGERTLISAVLPPGAAHIHGISSVSHGDARVLALVAGLAASILHDFAVRVAPKATISVATLERLPVVLSEPFKTEILLRSLRLNCLTREFAWLWKGVTGEDWNAEDPLRGAGVRRQAMLEIDVLVALALGVTADELCSVYRTQFPVLRGYDRTVHVFDRNGRLVPTAILNKIRKSGEGISEEDRTAVHPGSEIAYVYEAPFRTLDRETDLRTAYAEFERRLAARRENSA